MTPDRLREVIEAGESLDVEFKGESGRPPTPPKWLRQAGKPFREEEEAE